jgi:hypothetical protein
MKKAVILFLVGVALLTFGIGLAGGDTSTPPTTTEVAAPVTTTAPAPPTTESPYMPAPSTLEARFIDDLYTYLLTPPSSDGQRVLALMLQETDFRDAAVSMGYAGCDLSMDYLTDVIDKAWDEQGATIWLPLGIEQNDYVVLQFGIAILAQQHLCGTRA